MAPHQNQNAAFCSSFSSTKHFFSCLRDVHYQYIVARSGPEYKNCQHNYRMGEVLMT